MWLTDKQRKRVAPADRNTTGIPLPTRIVSNGEYMPMPQTPDQARVESAILAAADEQGARLGLSRRSFLRSGAGLAASFMAMNRVFGGDVFSVAHAETVDLAAAAERSAHFADQMIFDVQLHFIRDDYAWDGILHLGEYAKQWNADMGDITFDTFKFDNFVKEVWFDSDTKIGLISAAPADHGPNVIMNNDGLASARSFVNKASGSRRLLSHAVIAPGQPGWLEEIDRAIEELKPDGWKGYTLGDPFDNSQYPWRLDDEKLMYPAYGRMVKAGIRNVCIHKGLLPEDYENIITHWRHAMVDDVGKAAKDWPDLNFIIYHSGFRPLMTSPDPLLAQFDKTGRIDWVSDLADIPAEWASPTSMPNSAPPSAVARHASASRRRAARCADQGHGRRSCRLGHRQRLVRLAAMADRGDAPHRNTRRHAQGAWFRGPRRGRWRGEEPHLLANLARPLRHGRCRAPDAAWRTDALSAIKANMSPTAANRRTSSTASSAAPGRSLMPGIFDGKVVLVTGAAAGIGRAIAEAAAREGASLALGDVAKEGEAVAAGLRKAGAKAVFRPTDVRKKPTSTRWSPPREGAGRIAAHRLRNAGIEGKMGAPWETKEDDFTRVLDINLAGAWRTMTAVLPAMIERGEGAIVATASVAGLVGAGGLAAYVASKHGLVGLVKSVAIDVAKSGIRVNALCPGMIETAMVDRLATDVPGFREALLALKPMGRLGVPCEAAEAAIWLASPAASFITGHALAVDGGYAAQ